MYLPGVVFPFLGAYVTERIGRKIPLLIGVIGAIITPIIQAFSHGLPQLIVGRFLMGSFSSFAMIAGLSLCAELAREYSEISGCRWLQKSKQICRKYQNRHIRVVLTSRPPLACAGNVPAAQSVLHR